MGFISAVGIAGVLVAILATLLDERSPTFRGR